MISESFKRRILDYGKKVRVYKNLHNGKWSVQQNGLVYCHATHLQMKNVKCIVNEKTRLKVVKKQHKLVHAFLEGYITSHEGFIKTDGNVFFMPLYYNPYKQSSFTLDGVPVESVSLVSLNPLGVLATS